MSKWETPCSRCRGQGWILAPEWEQWWQEESVPPPDGHPLYLLEEEMECPECGGQGTVLTPAGRELLAFLRKYW